MTTRRVAALIPLTGIIALLLGGCLGPADSLMPGAQPPAVIRAEGEVIGTGMVIDDGGGAELCLGAIRTSYPPQCSGVPLIGWDWAAVDGVEQASGVSWGSYAVQGTWNGSVLTVTQPPMLLALYDPMRDEPDQRLDPANPGPSTAAELASLEHELLGLDVAEFLFAFPQNGRLVVTVVYDDGALQEWLDARYGTDAVVVQSVLRDVSR